jgi:hypothetical protein
VAMESVSSGIKRKAASVATTRTSWPASLRRRITPGALYAAMPPVTPTSTFATPVVYPSAQMRKAGTVRSQPMMRVPGAAGAL